MPSFFEGFKRIILGKPVFDESEAHKDPWAEEAKKRDPWAESDAPDAPTKADVEEDSDRSNQPKQLPLVAIRRFEYDEGSDHISYDFAIRNESSVSIDVIKVLLFGEHHEIEHYLHPGEEREFRVYDGHQHESQPNTYCELIYKDESGDYFKTVHYIETIKHADSIYRIKHVKYLPPVRDM